MRWASFYKHKILRRLIWVRARLSQTLKILLKFVPQIHRFFNGRPHIEPRFTVWPSASIKIILLLYVNVLAQVWNKFLRKTSQAWFRRYPKMPYPWPFWLIFPQNGLKWENVPILGTHNALSQRFNVFQIHTNLKHNRTAL